VLQGTIVKSIITTNTYVFNLFVSSIRPLDADIVSRNYAGLLTFAKNCAWKHVVDLSDELLKTDEYKIVPNTNANFNIVFRLRLRGLFHLKLFDDIASEVGKVLIAEEDYFRKNYSTDSAITSIGPSMNEKIISLRLFLIELKIVTGQVADAMDQLHTLRRYVKSYVRNSDNEIGNGNDSMFIACNVNL
jgi:hypothetical protein